VVTVTDPLGNSATATVTVGPGVTVSPQNPNLAPLGTLQLSVSGGSGSGYSWSFATNASGGTIDPVSGAYVAGAIGSVTDVVAAVDSLGNVGTAKIAIGPALAIAPASDVVSPRGKLTFVASGGSGHYLFSLTANGSAATIGASTGAYVAGVNGDTTDRVQVVDANGAIASARITVGPRVAISPRMPSALPGESISFDATGGSGSGYVWSLTVNKSGGHISTSGVYVAGSALNTVDTVRVVDSLGNAATVNVSVGAGITLNPARPTTPPRGTVTFHAMGGTGTGFTFSLVTNASGGSIVAATGVYTAGTKGGVIDIVEVTDSAGNLASASVSVGAAISVSPPNSMVPAGRTIAFSVTGGSGTGYVWSLLQNQSGATVDPATGLYIAGMGGGLDLVQVTDSLGNTGFGAVSVTATTGQARQGRSLIAAPNAGAVANAVTVATPARASAAGCQVGGGGDGGLAVVVATLLLLVLSRRRFAR
jgi:hypothetical protein